MGKEQIKEKEKKKEVWKRPHNLVFAETRTPLCKITLLIHPRLLISAERILKNRLCQEFSCVGFVTASSHPPHPPTPRVVEAETFSVLDVRTVPLVCREEDCGKSAPGHLLDKHQGAAADQIELNHNKLTRL